MKQELIFEQETKKESDVVYFDVADIWPIVLTFVVVGIGTSYGLQVMGDVQADMTVGSNEYNGTRDAILGVKKFPEKFDTLATVILAALVIGILWRYLNPGRM